MQSAPIFSVYIIIIIRYNHPRSRGKCIESALCWVLIQVWPSASSTRAEGSSAISTRVGPSAISTRADPSADSARAEARVLLARGQTWISTKHSADFNRFFESLRMIVCKHLKMCADCTAHCRKKNSYGSWDPNSRASLKRAPVYHLTIQAPRI